jgi:MFS family permease
MPLFRKCLLIVNALAFTVGCFIFIEQFYTLLFFRLWQGFCVGFYSAIVPLMVKELSPTEISGTMGSYAQLNTCMGVFTGCIFAYILKKVTGDSTGEKSWFLIFGLTQVTLAVQTAILVFVYPYETPKYLLSVGKEE